MLRNIVFVVLLVCMSVPAMCQSANPTATSQTKQTASKQPDAKSTVVSCKDSDKTWFKGEVELWDTPNPAVLGIDQKVGVRVGAVGCGESVTVLSDLNPMTRIRTKNGLEGYLPGGYVGMSVPKRSAETEALLKKARKFQKRYDKEQELGRKVCKKHPTWSQTICLQVSQHRIWIGMDLDMLRESVGRYSHINITYLPGEHTAAQAV